MSFNCVVRFDLFVLHCFVYPNSSGGSNSSIFIVRNQMNWCTHIKYTHKERTMKEEMGVVYAESQRASANEPKLGSSAGALAGAAD